MGCIFAVLFPLFIAQMYLMGKTSHEDLIKEMREHTDEEMMEMYPKMTPQFLKKFRSEWVK